jgi:KUP system potassium uptake protein
MDEPRAMDYQVNHVIPGILTRVDFFLGFRVEPRINAMFKQITNEMARTGEIDLFSGYPSLRKHNILTDFKFILIDRLNISDFDFKFKERLIMNVYLFFSRHSLSDVKALGFDASTVLIEPMSLGFDGTTSFRLNRKA